MIYLFHGSDVEKVRTRAFDWIRKAREKEPNLAYVRLGKKELTAAALDEAIMAGGLFVTRMLVLLDDPFPKGKSEDDEEGADGASIVEERLKALAETDNAIVILSPLLASSKVKKIEGNAKMTYVFDTKGERAAGRGFNTALVNALASRNKAALWLEVVRAMKEGDAPEMIHGLLHWKARDILQKGSRAWTPQESRKLSIDLIALLQESRRGGLALDVALERFALSL